MKQQEITFSFTADEVRFMFRYALNQAGVQFKDEADVTIFIQGSEWVAAWNGKGKITIEDV